MRQGKGIVRLFKCRQTDMEIVSMLDFATATSSILDLWCTSRLDSMATGVCRWLEQLCSGSLLIRRGASLECKKRASHITFT
jgi:hypothetical protein